MNLIHDEEKRDFEKFLGCSITEVRGERAAFKPDNPFTLESLTTIIEDNVNVDWQNPNDPFCDNGPDMLYLMTHHFDDDGLPYDVEMGYDLTNDTFYFV